MCVASNYEGANERRSYMSRVLRLIALGFFYLIAVVSVQLIFLNY